MLYEIPLDAIVPYGGIYARTKQDLVKLLPYLASRHGCPENALRNIQRREKAVVKLRVPGSKLEAPEAYIEVTPELEVITDQETIHRFEEVKKFFSKNARKVGNLYEVPAWLGKLPSLYFLPEDLYQSLMVYDISVYKAWAGKHEEKFQKGLREINGRGKK